MATTQIADVIVPSIFSPMVQLYTQEKSRLISSGAVLVDQKLSQNLAGAGSTFNEVYLNDLGRSADNIGSDDPSTLSTPDKRSALSEIQVRLSRNKSWSSMDLTASLIDKDPMDNVAQLVGAYWANRAQAAFIASMRGVFADNAAAPTASEHVQNDLTLDVKGSTWVADTTEFTTKSFINTTLTMGDSMEDLRLVMVHSVVYAKMLQQQLIVFVQDAVNPLATKIPTFLGREVIVDDSMPATAGVFESWFFSAGAVRMGMGEPLVPTEIYRLPAAGNGAGQQTLHSRVEWIIHPDGHAFIGTSGNGGPTNAATTGNLAHADSWKRAYPERKQVKIARLTTREF